jgi:hypothetical protein
VVGYQKVSPNPQRLIEERVGDDYIVLAERPNYQSEAAWRNEAERPGYIQANKLRFLRPYQLKAIYALQRAVKDGKDRFLFEMATGTGKTLTAAAVIKLFLRSGNARRVLFLVDRLELEDQAKKAFAALLSADFQTVIYKDNRDEWRPAEIVVTTVQSLLFNNKYQRLFSPTDFDLVISDEAHRSIGGNARAVFDYFIGYKLGLGAQRRAIEKNDLPQARAKIGEYLRRLRAGEPMADFQSNLGFIVEKEKVAANGDYNLSGERYRETGSKTHRFELVRIGDVCTVNPRKSQLGHLQPDTRISFVAMADLDEHRIAFRPSEQSSSQRCQRATPISRTTMSYLPKSRPASKTARLASREACSTVSDLDRASFTSCEAMAKCCLSGSTSA